MLCILNFNAIIVQAVKYDQIIYRIPKNELTVICNKKNGINEASHRIKFIKFWFGVLHNVIKSILKSYQKTHRKLNFCFVSNQEITTKTKI